VVGGGQTDNPSVQDIADAVRSVGAHDVIVMPNNKNIVMAAERVDELVRDKNVVVLPTRTLGQGLAGAVLFQESGSVDELVETMREAADQTLTLEVTTASRDVEIDGVSVAEGDFIGLADGTLRVSGPDAEACLMELLEERADDFEVATLFHSATVTGDAARALAARIHERLDHLEVEVHAGGPDLYPYLMTLE